jgi:hypothetical protein
LIAAAEDGLGDHASARVERPVEHPVALVVEREEHERRVELFEDALRDEPLVEAFARRAERIDEQRGLLLGAGRRDVEQRVRRLRQLLELAAPRDVRRVARHRGDVEPRRHRGEHREPEQPRRDQRRPARSRRREGHVFRLFDRLFRGRLDGGDLAFDHRRRDALLVRFHHDGGLHGGRDGHLLLRVEDRESRPRASQIVEQREGACDREER